MATVTPEYVWIFAPVLFGIIVTVFGLFQNARRLLVFRRIFRDSFVIVANFLHWLYAFYHWNYRLLLLNKTLTVSSVFVPLFLFFRLSFFLLAFFSSKLTFLDFNASSFCVFFYEKKNKVQFYLCSISNSFTSLVLVLRLLDLRLLLLLDLLDL